MIDALDRVRAKYASGNQSTKGQLTPGILDQEKRVKELREEIARLTLDIRNTEIRKLKILNIYITMETLIIIALIVGGLILLP